MTEVNCENVRTASMAEADGFSSLLTTAQLEAHLAHCADCRREVQEMQSFTRLLDAATRVRRDEQVWPLIEQRLRGVSGSRDGRFDWRPFLVLGFLLAGYRLILMMNGQQLGPWFKLVPVAIVMAVFVYVKENPFKINSQLRLEGVTS